MLGGLARDPGTTTGDRVFTPGAVSTPLAWLRGLVAARPLLGELVRRDIKVRYAQSILGLYWGLLHPLLVSLVLALVFSRVVRIDTGATPYFLFVLTGLLGWSYLAHALQDAVHSLVDHAPLISRVPFPREVLPFTALAARTVDFLVSGAVLLALVVVVGLPLGPSLAAVPLFYVVQVAFTCAVALLVAQGNLFYRDVRQLLSLGLMLGFYLTPVIYPLEMVPGHLQPFFLLNPMAVVVEGYRRALLLDAPPLWTSWAVALLLSLVLLVASYWLFKRNEPLFAERA